MYDWNGSIRSLNVGLPDDIARLKAAGYYQEAIARIRAEFRHRSLGGLSLGTIMADFD